MQTTLRLLALCAALGLCVSCGDEQPAGNQPKFEGATVGDWIDQLISFDERASFDAAQALARIGKPAAAPLTDLLSRKEAHVRQLAASTLADIGPEAASAAPALARALSDENAQVRLDAADALAAIGPGAASTLMVLREKRDAALAILEAKRETADPERGERPLRADIVRLVALDTAVRSVSESTVLPLALDPTVDGLRVSQWVRRWLRGARNGIDQKLLTRSAADVLPHVLPWDRRMTQYSYWEIAGPMSGHRRTVELHALFAKAAIPVFADALEQGPERCDQAARWAVLGAWSRLDIGPGDFESLLVPFTSSPDIDERLAATRILLGGPRTIDEKAALITSLLDAENWREHVLGAREAGLLGVEGGPLADRLQALQDRYRSDLETAWLAARMAVALALVELGDDAYPDMLAAEDQHVREAAKWAFRKSPPKSRPELLRRLLMLSDTYAVSWAGLRLWEQGPEGRKVLQEVSRTDEGRAAVVDVLAELGERATRSQPPEEVPDYSEFLLVLIDALQGDHETRTAALTALGALGPKAKSAAPAIRVLIESASATMPADDSTDFDTSWVIRAALESYVEVTSSSEDARAAVRAAMAHAHPQVREAAANAMANLDPVRDADIDALFELIQSSGGAASEDLDWATGLATVVQERPDLVGRVVDLLDDPRPSVRRAGLEVMNSVRTPSVEHLRRVFRLLSDEVQEVAWQASRVVSSYVDDLGHDAIPVLLENARSDKTIVRESVVRGFASLGWSAGSAIGDLETLAREGPPHQRRTASIALEVIRGDRRIGAANVFQEESNKK